MTDWTRRFAGCGLGRVLHLARTVSTQNRARKLAERGAPDRTLVIADRQTRGRGRMDNRWSSGPGGLYFSLILRPKMVPSELAALSGSTADICARVLAKASGLRTFVKPPNDVFALSEHSGPRKVCGILIEASGGSQGVDWIVIGIGINLNNRIPSSLKEAGSLRALSGKEFDLADVLTPLLRALVANTLLRS